MAKMSCEAEEPVNIRACREEMRKESREEAEAIHEAH